MHISLQATDLQVYPDMLGVCSSGIPQMGAVQGFVPYRAPSSEMPPVGRLRLRPRSVNSAGLADDPDEDVAVKCNVLEFEFILITVLVDECGLKFTFSPRMETLDFNLLCKIDIVK